MADTSQGTGLTARKPPTLDKPLTSNLILLRGRPVSANDDGCREPTFWGLLEKTVIYGDGDRRLRGGKNAKKRAAVAVARKLAVLLHRLWVSGEVYEPLRNSQKALGAVA